MNTSTSIGSLKRKTHVLNQKEREIYKTVSLIYNLRPEDFETEKDYDDYLEEKETVKYNLVHNEDAELANAKMRDFKQKNYQIIEKRKAQDFDKQKGVQKTQTLPLLAQKRYEAKARQASASSFANTLVNYTNDNFLSEIEKRKEEWKEHENIPLGIVGGLPDELLLLKAKQELADTLFIYH